MSAHSSSMSHAPMSRVRGQALIAATRHVVRAFSKGPTRFAGLDAA